MKPPVTSTGLHRNLQLVLRTGGYYLAVTDLRMLQSQQTTIEHNETPSCTKPQTGR